MNDPTSEILKIIKQQLNSLVDGHTLEVSIKDVALPNGETVRCWLLLNPDNTEECMSFIFPLNELTD